MEFIPESIWIKNKEDKVLRKSKWLECHYDVIVFCAEENLEIFKTKESKTKSKRTAVFRRVENAKN